jgi:hypothetical protein
MRKQQQTTPLKPSCGHPEALYFKAGRCYPCWQEYQESLRLKDEGLLKEEDLPQNTEIRMATNCPHPDRPAGGKTGKC